jgi:hypothetical protein
MEGRLRLLFTPRDEQGVVLTLTATKRFADLAQKVKQAIGDNPKLLLSRKSGEPLPYSPDLGITEGEYNEFLALAENGGMALQETGKVALSIVDQPPDHVLIKSLPEIGELDVDLKTGVVEVLGRKLAMPNSISPNENQELTGPFHGYSWKSGVLAAITQSRTEVTIGQQRDSQEVLLFFDVRGIDPKVSPSGESLFAVRFSAPTEEVPSPAE